MIITLRKDNNILILPNDYASVEQFDDNTVQIRIRTVIGQGNIIKKNALTTRVTFTTTTSVTKTVTNYVKKSQKDSRIWAGEIKQAYTKLYTQVKTTQENILGTLNLDNTKMVDNSIVSDVVSGRSSGKSFGRAISLKTVAQLTDEGAVAPLLLVNNNKISTNAPVNVETTLRNVVVENGIDPSWILELPHSGTMFLNQAVNGLIENTKYNKLRRDDVVKLESYYRTIMVPTVTIAGTSTNDIDATKLLPYIDSSNSDLVEVSDVMTIKLSDLRLPDGGYNNLGIKFDVLNKSKQILQTETMQFNFAQYFELMQIPITPPIIENVAQGTDGLCLLSLRQLDEKANNIRIYRKVIQRHGSDIEPYELLDNINVDKSTNYVNFRTNVSQGETTLFRAIPVGKNANFGFDYTNVVVKSLVSEKNDIHVAINARSYQNGVLIEIRELPANVVSVSILRRDLTIFESKQIVVLDKVIFVDTLGRTSNPSLLDITAVGNRVYEYSCRLNFLNGSTIDCGNCVFEHTIPQVKVASTQISNLSMVSLQTGIDIKFDVKTLVTAASFDVIKQLLENQGLIEYFRGDIFNERDKLQQLLTHLVVRVDLNTGIYEDLGLFDGGTFSDFEARSKLGASAPISGHEYRYDVYVLLRASETLFENYTKVAEDKLSKKQYRYNPFKFFHPVTLHDGVIVTPESVRLNYGKSTFTFGNVGNLSSINAMVPIDNCNVVGVTAEILRRGLVIVKWNLVGDVRSIDHFIVLNERLGSRMLVGKAHAQTGAPYRLIHTLDENERGSYRYIVRIVYNDYNLGPEVLSNEVIV
jgi:hypothetical protein